MTDKNVSRLHLVTGSRVTCRSAGLRYALSRMQRDSWWACKLSMASVTGSHSMPDQTAPCSLSPPGSIYVDYKCDEDCKFNKAVVHCSCSRPSSGWRSGIRYWARPLIPLFPLTMDSCSSHCQQQSSCECLAVALAAS